MHSAHDKNNNHSSETTSHDNPSQIRTRLDVWGLLGTFNKPVEKKEQSNKLNIPPTIIFYERRKPDFTRICESNHNKTLFITAKLKKIEAPHYSGNRMSDMGPHCKIPKMTKNPLKIYYKMPHISSAYLRMEILNVLGFNSPKCRFVKTPVNESASYKKNYLMATKAIQGHIPISALRNEEKFLPIEESDYWKKLVKQTKKYRLNIQKQVIEQVDNQNKLIGEYKISGNLFCTDIAAKLLGDTDLQPNGENIVLIREGNRFKAFLIDKDISTDLFGKTCQELTELLEQSQKRRNVTIINDPLFQQTDSEQRMAIISALQEALRTPKGHLGLIDCIFLNSRIRLTFNEIIDTIDKIKPDNKKYLEDLCSQFKKTAQSVLKCYTTSATKDAKENVLDAFQIRETVRIEIAQQAITDLQLPQELLPQIVEDLRGPYYKQHLIETALGYRITENGFKQLKSDLLHEFLLDTNGLEAIFEEHMMDYSNRSETLTSIRNQFARFKMERNSNPDINIPQIGIMIGCLLHHRRLAEQQHSEKLTRYLWKSQSSFADKIDAVLNEFCLLTDSYKTQCLQIYNDYYENIIKPEILAEKTSILQRTLASIIEVGLG